MSLSYTACNGGLKATALAVGAVSLAGAATWVGLKLFGRRDLKPPKAEEKPADILRQELVGCVVLLSDEQIERLADITTIACGSFARKTYREMKPALIEARKAASSYEVSDLFGKIITRNKINAGEIFKIMPEVLERLSRAEGFRRSWERVRYIIENCGHYSYNAVKHLPSLLEKHKPGKVVALLYSIANDRGVKTSAAYDVASRLADTMPLEQIAPLFKAVVDKYGEDALYSLPEIVETSGGCLTVAQIMELYSSLGEK